MAKFQTGLERLDAHTEKTRTLYGGTIPGRAPGRNRERRKSEDLDLPHRAIYFDPSRQRLIGRIIAEPPKSQQESISPVIPCVCVILYMWRLVGRKTRVGTLIKDNYVSGENYRHVSGSWISDVNGVKQRERRAQMWRRLRNVHVLLHARAYGDYPVSLAMTHMRRLHGQSGHKSTGYLRRVASLAHRYSIATRTWAEVNVRPRPFVNVNRREDRARPDKTTLSKFTCVDNDTFWKVPW